MGKDLNFLSELNAEPTAIWFGRNEDSPHIVIKAPSTCIKAILDNCGLKLKFSVYPLSEKTKVLIAGVLIYDDVSAPAFLYGAIRNTEEHGNLYIFLRETLATLTLYNEMDLPVASGKIQVSKNDGRSILDSFPTIDRLYYGPFTFEIEEALDSFESRCNPKINPSFEESPKIFPIDTQLSCLQAINSYIAGDTEINEVTLSIKDEGLILENQIWAALEKVFPNSLFKSPKYKKGRETKEITDILAYHPGGNFLIEAKAMAMLDGGHRKKFLRKKKGIKNQILKAIKQLSGATKNFDSNTAIFSNDNVEISLNREIRPHCIILISELIACEEWSDIPTHLLEAMKKTNSYFHVLDLREFIYLLKLSSGDAIAFDSFLLYRLKEFFKTRSINLRIKYVDQK